MKTTMSEEKAIKIIDDMVAKLEKWGKQADLRVFDRTVPEAIVVLYRAGRIGTTKAEVAKANRQAAAEAARAALAAKRAYNPDSTHEG